MKLIRQLGRVIFTLGAKSGDNKVSITVKPFKILIVVFPTQRMSTIQSGIVIQHPFSRGLIKLRKAVKIGARRVLHHYQQHCVVPLRKE